MSRIDPEILYLILTKVAAKESFYNHDPAQLAPGQPPGTITYAGLSEVYKRITSQSPGPHVVWAQPLKQLAALLLKCGLPPLTAVVEAGATAPSVSADIARIQATRWPPFRDLKTLYRKGP